MPALLGTRLRLISWYVAMLLVAVGAYLLIREQGLALVAGHAKRAGDAPPGIELRRIAGHQFADERVSAVALALDERQFGKSHRR